MTYSTQLKIGRKVEKEHSKTYALSQKKKLTRKQFYDSIAKDHLKEDKNYYSKLKKAKL